MCLDYVFLITQSMIYSFFQAKVICSVRYIIDIVLVAIIIGGKAMQQVIGQFTDDFPQKTI